MTWTTQTIIYAGVPIAIRDSSGELIAVIRCDENVVLEDGRLVGPVTARADPGLLAAWRAEAERERSR